MDDSLRALEQRLEQLVPKGLSDLGRERLEDRVDQLAEALSGERDAAAPSRSDWWKWGAGAAAGAVFFGALWLPQEESNGFAGTSPSPVLSAGVTIPAVDSPPARESNPSVDLLTLALARQVDGRMDQGWVMTPGLETPHRYWSYEVTDEEEMIDAESGYSVRIVSQQEEWVPVALTSL